MTFVFRFQLFQLLQKIVAYHLKERDLRKNSDQLRSFYSIHVAPEITLQTHSAINSVTASVHSCGTSGYAGSMAERSLYILYRK